MPIVCASRERSSAAGFYSTPDSPRDAAGGATVSGRAQTMSMHRPASREWVRLETSGAAVRTYLVLTIRSVTASRSRRPRADYLLDQRGTAPWYSQVATRLAATDTHTHTTLFDYTPFTRHIYICRNPYQYDLRYTLGDQRSRTLIYARVVRFRPRPPPPVTDVTRTAMDSVSSFALASPSAARMQTVLPSLSS